MKELQLRGRQFSKRRKGRKGRAGVLPPQGGATHSRH